MTGLGMETDVGTTYTWLRTGEIAGQRQVAAGVIVDVDADHRVLGMETIGDVPWESALMLVVLAAQVPKDTWPR